MTDHSKAEEPPYIVGIGTSAGGLEALEKFFSSAPPLTGLAFVVIQHLSPDYKSHMVQLLSKYTPLSVFEAEDGMPVETNSIYLLPRRKNMTIFKGKLYTVDYNRSHGGLNLPIDIFFESLAHDQGERSVGIILSGTGSDGTRGIRAIKEQGGLVIAQDDSAKFDGMPRSAISTRLVDYILPPEKIAITLLKYIKHPSLAADGIFEVPIPVHDNQLAKLFAVVQASTGVDFTDYKPNTILRRIERRMTVNQIENLNDYVTVLQDSPDESRTLYKEFLIGVTRFFRDGEAFQKIQDTVIPGLLQGRSRQSQVRVWIPGCSTGEEAYSLAILFREHMEKTGQYFDIKIFATDLDKEALDFASRGVYQESVLADISTERLRNFFVKRGDTYEVLRPLRGLVVFAHQNLIKDPPFSKMDLISCRNLLIYLQPKLQQRVLSIFQFALNSDGYLFLGSSESVGDFADVFKTIDNKWKLFQFDGTIRPRLDQTQLTGRTESPRSVGVTAYRQPIAQGTDDWRTSDPVLRSLVEQVMPPCLVVDENGSIIHAFGDLEPYLKLPQGYQIDLNVRKMAREPLSLPLSTALHRTSQNEEEVVYSNIRLESGPEINLTVRLFFEKNSRQRLFLIMFTPTDTPGGNPETAEIFSLPKGAAQRINVLEQELQYTKENLQATIEELETSNEELQATNEELMAANEELQSTNEELQSVNEELITVNSEYQAKIMELTNLNDDVNNLLKSTDVGTIFLDANLHLRKFTRLFWWVIEGGIKLWVRLTTLPTTCWM